MTTTSPEARLTVQPEEVIVAVERAVAQANQQAEVVRLKAVETAATAVASHWKLTHEAKLAEVAAAAAKDKTEAVDLLRGLMRESCATQIEEATRKVREEAETEAAVRQSAAVAEAIAAESERKQRELTDAVEAAEARATTLMAAAISAAHEEAAREAAAMLEARSREAQADRLATLADGEVEARGSHTMCTYACTLVP